MRKLEKKMKKGKKRNSLSIKKWKSEKKKNSLSITRLGCGWTVNSLHPLAYYLIIKNNFMSSTIFIGHKKIDFEI